MNEKSVFNNRVWITWISKRNRLAYIEFIKIAIGASKGNTSIVWTCSQNIPCVRKIRNTMKGGCLSKMPATMLQVLANIRLLEQRIIISIFQERNIQ